MANYQCDGVTVEIPDAVLPIVKQWVDKRDGEIASLTRKEIKIDCAGKTYTVDSAMSSHPLIKDMSEIAAKAKETEDEKDAMKAKCDALNAELEKAKTAAIVPTNLSARRSLERTATPYLKKADSAFKEDAFDAMSDRQIKERVVAYSLPKLADTLPNRTDIAVDAMFEVATQSPPNQDANTELRFALDHLQSTANNDGLNYVRDTESAWNWINGGAK